MELALHHLLHKAIAYCSSDQDKLIGCYCYICLHEALVQDGPHPQQLFLLADQSQQQLPAGQQ
jgi:hypothetical protein